MINSKWLKMHCFGKYIGNALYLVVVYIDKQQLLTGTLIKEKSAAESLKYFNIY